MRIFRWKFWRPGQGLGEWKGRTGFDSLSERSTLSQ